MSSEPQLIHEIKEFVKSVGFPIVSFFLMFWLCNSTLKKNTEAVLQNTTTLERVREATAKLLDKLEVRR